MENKTPKCTIAGIQSVMPVEVTQHREIRPIIVEDAVGSGIFRRSLNIVMYYHKEGDCCEKGWLVAGWIKESLGRALTEQPMLSGRLRRRESCGDLELVSNDSGVRLVEARVPVSLPEFVEMVKRDKSKAEAETVFWRDIDEHDPQFSPLFYVQVTNFSSGGYSVGISCSILIADILLGTDFFTKWSQIQTSIASLPPIFHLPSLKNGHLGHLTADLPTSSPVVPDRGTDPIVYLVRPKTFSELSPEVYMKKIAEICEKSEETDVLLFLKEKGCDGMKVKIHSGVKKAISDCDLEKLDDGVLRFEEIAFGKEKVEHSSCWIGCVSKGVVFVVSSLNSPTKIVVALPKV